MTHVLSRRTALRATLGTAVIATLVPCAGTPGTGGWETLVDGSRPEPLAERWRELGEGHWRYADGALEGRTIRPSTCSATRAATGTATRWW